VFLECNIRQIEDWIRNLTKNTDIYLIVLGLLHCNITSLACRRKASFSAGFGAGFVSALIHLFLYFTDVYC